MTFLSIQNLTTMGPVVSEITLIETDTNARQTDKRIVGNGKLLFSYSRGHELSRKYKSGHSSDGLDYYTSLAYAREVKVFWRKMFGWFLRSVVFLLIF